VMGSASSEPPQAASNTAARKTITTRVAQERLH
jgi:hypothetical protein